LSEGANLLRDVLSRMDEAASRLKLDWEIYKTLRSPRTSLTVTFPIRMDNGSVEIFTGYRVLYNYARGPSKGGVRYHSARGRGVSFITSEIMNRLNIRLKDATVAIQGFGNVGSNTARFLHQEVCKVVGVTDLSGGVFDEEGLDLPGLLNHIKSEKKISGFRNGEFAADYRKANERLIKSEVDILVPAALENQITERNAAEVKAKVIVEGANGPITSVADKILAKKGKTVVPDIVANSGGVIVSYFEWVQDVQAYLWTENQVNQRLKEVITDTFSRVWNMAEEHKTDLRHAAYMEAVGKVVETTKLRGIFP